MNRRGVCALISLVGVSGCLRFGSPETETRSEEPSDAESETGDEKPIDELSLSKRWEYGGIGRNLSSFASVDGRFFAVDYSPTAAQRILSFDTDGDEIWSSDPLCKNQRIFGLVGTIAVDTDTVYVASRHTDSDRARITAFDRGSGEKRWYDETDSSGTRSRITNVELTDNLLLYASDTAAPTQAQDPLLRALDKSTGEQRWAKSYPRNDLAGAAVYDETVFLGTSDGLLIYNTRGEELDRIDINSGVDTKQHGEFVYTYAHDESSICAIDAASHELRWSEPFAPDPAGIEAGFGSVYVSGTDGLVVRCDSETGNRRWTTEAGTKLTPQEHFVWVETTDGSLRALSAANGDRIYEERFADGRYPDIATSGNQLVVSRGAVAYTVSAS